MTDSEMLDWLQMHAYDFRHGMLEDEFFLTWLDKDGISFTTKGNNLRDAVIGAKLARDEMHK